jgi:hypothetical protein
MTSPFQARPATSTSAKALSKSDAGKHKSISLGILTWSESPLARNGRRFGLEYGYDTASHSFSMNYLRSDSLNSFQTSKMVRAPERRYALDDFPLAVKELLAKRVAYHCSNPGYRHVTSGPQEDKTRVINIGVAAHITAASPDGPRYDPSLTAEQRSRADNGLWLCQSCGKLVDNDKLRYTVAGLRDWKILAEATAARDLERPRIAGNEDRDLFIKIERAMPDLLPESSLF